MIINFEIKHEFTADQINDLIVTALEGGINYWCSGAKEKDIPEGIEYEYISELIGKGGSLILIEDETGEEHELTPEKFKVGIEKYCEHVNMYPDDMFDNHDAESADCIIQFALFNEIVYG